MSEKPSARAADSAPTYTLFRNIGYILGNIWRWQKVLLPLISLNALLKVVQPFILIFMPKLVIDALSAAQPQIAQVVGTILQMSLILLIVQVLIHLSDRDISNRALNNRRRYNLMRSVKALRTDYTNIESAEGQRAREKAALATNMESSGTNAIIIHGAALISHVLGLVFYAAVVAQLSLWMVAFLFILALASFLASQRARSYEAAHADDIAEANKKRRYSEVKIHEFTSAKDIRLYEMADWLLQRMNGYIQEQMHWRRNIRVRYFAADGLTTVLSALRDGVAYAWLIALVLQGAIGIGDFSLYFAAVAGIANWLNLIMQDMGRIDLASREIGYLRSYLDMPDRIIDSGDSSGPFKVGAAPEIVFEAVSFQYPGSAANILDNFSIRIAGGEKVALVGLNGAGKTTCVKLLLGLYLPTAGRILIDGRDTRTIEKEELFAVFAPVFQESRLLALDLEQNVSLCVQEQSDAERVEQSLALAGLAEKLNSLPHGLSTPLTRVMEDDGIELSGGETQKLMLARALYKDAPMVVMDEPTAALDPLAEAEHYQRYNQMTQDKTALYISHRLASTRFCDRIVYLENGRALEIGSHEELMAQGGRYAELFRIQSSYYQEERAGEQAGAEGGEEA